MVDFIVMVASAVLVDPRIKPGTIVSVRSCCAVCTVSVPVACSHCQRTFWRPQGMARHKCSEPED